MRSFTCGRACRSGRLMPGGSAAISGGPHEGEEAESVGLAAADTAGESLAEQRGVRHTEESLEGDGVDADSIATGGFVKGDPTGIDHAEAVGLEGEAVFWRALGKPLLLLRNGDVVADNTAPTGNLDVLDGVGGETESPDGSFGDAGQEGCVVACLGDTIGRAELGDDAGEFGSLLAEDEKPEAAGATVKTPETARTRAREGGLDGTV